MSTLGVIFTDTCALADKYSCQRIEVLHLLQRFIGDSDGQGVGWQLVDVGGHDFDYVFQNDRSWRGYCRALDDNCIGMGWQTNCNTPLLIIGGDDVIPLPIEKLNIQEEPKDLQVDMYYGYPWDFQMRNEIERARKSVSSSFYDVMMSKALFNVSRLPLENGKIRTTLQQDLGGYFSRSIETRGTIVVDHLLPISAVDWYMSVRHITEGIELLSLGQDTPYWISDIIISPNLALEKPKGLEELLTALSKADMLLFNTHGGNDIEQSGFLGQGPGGIIELKINEEDSCFNKYVYDMEHPLAFDVPLLPCSKARILNTLACYGARFVGYDRPKSMLLSALYGNFLLYMGSCETAYGRSGYKDENNVFRLTGCAETLMKFYIHLLIEGEPAGLALLKAKWRYYKDCCEEDGDNMATYTIFEFNQFGNPALKVMNTNHSQNCETPTMNNAMRNEVSYKRERLHTFTSSSSTGISELDDLYLNVRTSLDRAMVQLREELGDMLEKDYCYSKKDLLLKQIVQVNEPRSFGERLFQYDYGKVKNGEHVVIVRVDRYGKPKDVFHTI